MHARMTYQVYTEQSYSYTKKEWRNITDEQDHSQPQTIIDKMAEKYSNCSETTHSTY